MPKVFKVKLRPTGIPDGSHELRHYHVTGDTQEFLDWLTNNTSVPYDYNVEETS